MITINLGLCTVERTNPFDISITLNKDHALFDKQILKRNIQVLQRGSYCYIYTKRKVVLSLVGHDVVFIIRIPKNELKPYANLLRRDRQAYALVPIPGPNLVMTETEIIECIDHHGVWFKGAL